MNFNSENITNEKYSKKLIYLDVKKKYNLLNSPFSIS